MSITEKEISFKDLEEKIFKEVCSLGCAMLKDVLEEMDKELQSTRDKSEYRNKGKRKTTIKTVMGEVEFERTVYEACGESGMKKYVYLLDEKLGRNRSGFFSGLMSEYIVKASCESSYRNAAENISSMTGQRISHTAAWNVVQELGQRVGEIELKQADAAKQNKGKGRIESKVLYEEQDGIWLKLQGKSRKKYGAGKEMKLAIAYDGVEEIGKGRYKLTNKVACASFEGTAKFVKRKEGVIADNYAVDEIQMRFLNGDGAEWIKGSAKDDEVHFQLDPYHRNKAIITYVRDKEKQKLLFELLYSKRIPDLIDCIEAYINCSEEEQEIADLNRLYTYFKNNKEGLIDIHRRGLNIPKEYNVSHNMGCMESNVFTLVGSRMKNGRACWSIEGGENLARLRCLKITGKLSTVLEQLTSIVLPEKYTEVKEIAYSQSKVPKKIGKGYNGFKQGGVFPATPDYKFLRKFGYAGFEA